MGFFGARGGAAGRWLGALRPPLSCAALFLAGAAGAQVELDGSLGPAGPVPFDGTTWHVTDDLGTRSGANLFHSLSLFDVPEGKAASFHLLDPSAPEPDFVIARVTGGDRSDIDGRLRFRHDGASLFLLNPSGFSFGPQSVVDAVGSVYVSTADVLRFGGDGPFDARSSATPEVLSADAPSAFGFLSDGPNSIEFHLDTAPLPGVPASDFNLPVPAGGTLAAVGGDVLIQDSDSAAGGLTIRIEGGTLALASVRSAGIDIPVDVASFDARGQGPNDLGTVTIANNAVIDVQSTQTSLVGAGRVVVRGGRLVIDASRIDDIAGVDLPGAAIAVDVEASESAVVRNGSRLTVISQAGSPGNVRVSAPSVVIEGLGTQVLARARGAGKAPDVEVEADEFQLVDQAQVLLRSSQSGFSTIGGRFEVVADSAAILEGASVRQWAEREATGGGIAFDVGSLRVAGGGAVWSDSTGGGAGGPIEIATGALAVETGGQLLSTTSAAGSGGRIAVAAEVASVTGPSQIRSLGTGSGPGGAIDVAAGDLRVEARGQIVSENTGSGAGGRVDVRALRDVAVTSRGKILSQATGAASNAGGDVDVRAGVRILVVGEDSTDADASQLAALTSSTSPGGSGGRLHLSAPTIELRDAGQLRTTTTGAGPGGSLDVDDTDLLLVVGNATIDKELAGAGLFARTTASDRPGAPAGDGGDLTIAARVVQVEDGGEVSARTFADGDAGNLVVTGAESVTVRGGPRGVSTLSSKGATGKGGNIEIIGAGTVELSSRGQVSASTLGTGDAGRVVVSADRIAISGEESGLFSQTTFPTPDSGAAGDIEVAVAQSLEVRDGGRISVDSSGGGAAGDVTIRGGPGASVALVGGNVSARSRFSADAGNVTIATGGDFVAGRGSSVVTQADNASGGRVTIAAGGIVYASDSRIDTLVASGLSSGIGDGGDVDVPGTLGAPPGLAVLNRSAIVATAVDGNGGNIRVAAGDLLASQGVVIDATSERGVAGEVQITSPDATLAGQITPLPSNFFDASRLMTTACDARRARTGSFVVQTRKAVEPLPDAPLAPSDLDAGRGEARDDGNCPG